MKLLEDKISDRRFTRLIWKSLRAGYFEFREYKHNIIGTFQGSIISPILANIFLHQFDIQVEKLKKEFDRGKHSKVNPIYNNLRYTERVARNSGDLETANKIAKEKILTNYSMFDDDGYKKMEYVRYADD